MIVSPTVCPATLPSLLLRMVSCFFSVTAILKDERASAGTPRSARHVFKTSPEFWMNLQMTYDLRNAERALPAKVRKSIEENRSVLA